MRRVLAARDSPRRSSRSARGARRQPQRRRPARRRSRAWASTSAWASRCRSTSSCATRTGARCALGAFFGERPVVLALVYYECPMLCTLVLNGLAGALKGVGLDAGQGLRGRRRELRSARDPGAGAGQEGRLPRALRPPGDRRRPGTSSPAIAGGDRAPHRGGRLPLRLGRGGGAVRAPERHPDRDARGRASRATSSAPTSRRATCGWRWSRRRAGKIGTLTDQVLLYCYHYDPATGRYSAAVMNLVRAGALATVAVARAGHRRLLAQRAGGAPQALRPRSAGTPSHVEELPALPRQRLLGGGERRRPLLRRASGSPPSSRCSSPARSSTSRCASGAAIPTSTASPSAPTSRSRSPGR